MNATEKEITYQSSNSYSTLNTLTQNTKHVWLVCHGMGYLSRYFLRYFTQLNTDENYIIAPQAPSKYYIQPGFKHVGASWLTKENTGKETENVMSYLDAVLETEHIPQHLNLIVFGYSQGVSIAMRYVAKRQLKCSQLVLHSGGIPKELVAEDFKYLLGKAKITMIYGTQDEYLNDERILHETHKVQELFEQHAHVLPFNGKHVVNVEFINQLV
ncbi:MAG: esterase [Flavobacteriaceae bacterium]|nr:esterase [Flavobacteriaceae bacterium]